MANGFDPNKFLRTDFNPDRFLKMDEPKTIEEMHPLISTKDRTIVKNFSNNPMASAAYLQKKYPNLVIQPNEKGRILIKTPEEANFKVLDPDTGMFSKDIINDMADIVYDVGGGVVEGAATIGGGIGGAAIGAPTGPGAIGTALAGAAAAGGSTSAGVEAFRQKIGQALGIPQDMNWGQVGMAGLIGTAAAPLGGVGAAPLKQLAKQGVKSGILKKTGGELLEKGLAPYVAKQTLGKAYQFGTRKLFPAFASKLSGVTPRAIGTLGRHYDEIVGLEKKGITDFVKKSFKDIKTPLDTARKEAWKQKEEIVSKIPGIDIREIKLKLTEYADNMAKQFDALPSEETLQIAEKAAKDINKMIPTKDVVSGDAVLILKKQLDKAAEFHKLKPSEQMVSRFSPAQSAAQIEKSVNAAEAVDILNKSLDDLTKDWFKITRLFKIGISLFFIGIIICLIGTSLWYLHVNTVITEFITGVGAIISIVGLILFVYDRLNVTTGGSSKP